MNITILDGFCANPGDLSWQEFASLGNLTVYDRTAPDEVISRARDAEILLTNKTVLDADTISRLPKLRYIGVLATGTNVVDIDAARRRGIIVTNVPAYSTDSVAQMTFALLLAITNRVETYAHLNRHGEWAQCEDFCYQRTPLIELAGKLIGIISLGNIGMKVAHIAHAMGMNVAAVTSKSADRLPEWITPVDEDTLFTTADVISLHCPLTPSTRHIVNSRTLGLMKRSAILLNTSRGPLVDEYALADALREHRIAAAGLDVLEKEPPEADNPLFILDNCFITPHIAWATNDARTRLLNTAAANIRAFLASHPINTVS